MSAITHSHMRAIAPKIVRSICALAPKGVPFSFLVLLIGFYD
jgi:hypothetical protein